VVGLAGFEPTTSCAPCKRATKLRHSPTSLTSFIEVTLINIARSSADVKGFAKSFCFLLSVSDEAEGFRPGGGIPAEDTADGRGDRL
jgi:hypothetical protein